MFSRENDSRMSQPGISSSISGGARLPPFSSLIGPAALSANIRTLAFATPVPPSRSGPAVAEPAVAASRTHTSRRMPYFDAVVFISSCVRVVARRSGLQSQRYSKSPFPSRNSVAVRRADVSSRRENGCGIAVYRMRKVKIFSIFACRSGFMLEKFYIFTLKYPGKESGPAFFVPFARFCSGALRYGEHE